MQKRRKGTKNGGMVAKKIILPNRILEAFQIGLGKAFKVDGKRNTADKMFSFSTGQGYSSSFSSTM